MNTKNESERRIATILFADISGFTAMSEKMDPEEVTGIMNDCFEMMNAVITENEGKVDKYIGDCAMVTFGAVKAIENAPYKAINTAIDIRNKLKQFNSDKKFDIPLTIHIGINTGEVIAGLVGSGEMKNFSVMGDAVNLAARLEDASQTGQILVEEETYKVTKAFFPLLN